MNLSIISKKALAGCVLALCCATFHSANAQQQLEGIVIEELEARATGDFNVLSPDGVALVDTYKLATPSHTTNADRIDQVNVSQPQEILQKTVPGLIINDASGSQYRSQIEFRGFSAGSLTGFPQGLSVYQNGARVNEVFGDTVFFDFIPTNSISDITVLTGNPVFGLNAVGGAVSIVNKDGFNFQGTEVEIVGGSFGTFEFGVEHGFRTGNWAGYAAYEKIISDGYRDFSEVDIDRFYGDIGYRTSQFEAHFNLTLARSSAGVVAASPVELLEIDRELTFTSPQTTDVELILPQLRAKVKATPTLTLSGQVYYRRFRSDVVDGNLFDGEECGEVAEEEGLAVDPDDEAGFIAATGVSPEALCGEDDFDAPADLADAVVLGLDGNPIEEEDVEDAAGDGPIGVIDRITQEAESAGVSIQAVEQADLFGLKNKFLVGASYDHGEVNFQTSSEVGTIQERFVVSGSGLFIGPPGDFAPRNVDVETDYVGVYFSNVTELSDQLTLAVGGRYNYAHVDLLDLTGNFDGITSTHTFEAFNPNVGLAYEPVKGLVFYGTYYESNRAPTPGELACANPDNPCPIESFLTDDPPLEQVESETYEFGVKGRFNVGDHFFRYSAGYFNTLSKNDILFVSSPTIGLGFFLNAGDTRREGVELSLEYKNGPLYLYSNYAFIDATFESVNEFNSPSNPAAVPCTFDDQLCVNTQPGDRIPGIPQHRFKFGAVYDVTEKWQVGGDVIAASSQFFLGDEGNDAATLGGYTRVDLNTKYKLNQNVELFAYANNVFDREYGLFGTFFEADEAGEVVEDGGVAPLTAFNDARTILPAPPAAIYGGVRVKY